MVLSKDRHAPWRATYRRYCSAKNKVHSISVQGKGILAQNAAVNGSKGCSCRGIGRWLKARLCPVPWVLMSSDGITDRGGNNKMKHMVQAAQESGTWSFLLKYMVHKEIKEGWFVISSFFILCGIEIRYDLYFCLLSLTFLWLLFHCPHVFISLLQSAALFCNVFVFHTSLLWHYNWPEQ